MGFTDVLKKAFPFLTIAASMVPGGNIATSVLGKVLNLSSGATLDDAGVALLNATPEQRATLLAEENRHEEALKQMGINSIADYERIAAADRASARQMQVQVRSWIPAGLAIFVTAGFFGILGLMFKYQPPATAHDALMLLLGSLGTAWISIISYYFGSSAGSASKDKVLSDIAKGP